MKTIKVSEATGPVLDWLVAEASGTPIYRRFTTMTRMDMDGQHYWNPTTNWAQGGLIIERERITVNIGWFDEQPLASIWVVSGGSGYAACKQRGTTPLIAAMRCYVASKLGDTAEVPDELL
jgi:Protein of unknown function (DUF2591)